MLKPLPNLFVPEFPNGGASRTRNDKVVRKIFPLFLQIKLTILDELFVSLEEQHTKKTPKGKEMNTGHRKVRNALTTEPHKLNLMWNHSYDRSACFIKTMTFNAPLWLLLLPRN